ncbi:hypothetical protein V8E54_011978 [Elaphomyces granulatus]
MTDITYHLPVPRISPWLSSSTITIPNLRSISQGVFELALRPATGQEAPGIQTKSSLETFWKMWHLVYKAEVLAIVAEEKNLSCERRPKATMYIEDVAEFVRVLLATTEMSSQAAGSALS